MKEKEELIQELLSLPGEIETIELDILKKNESLREISDLIRSKEADIKSSINAAQDENGKKVFTNDQARQAEFIASSHEDTELCDLYLQESKLSTLISIARINIDRLSNHQRNIRAVIDWIK